MTETVTINIDPELREFVQKRAQQKGLPLSVYVRRLFVDGLNQELCDFSTWRLFKNLQQDDQNF